MCSRLASTSALVLLWEEGSIHSSPLSTNYRKLLNLGSAKDLYSICNKICPYYSEVIKNRKHSVLELVFLWMKENKSSQIIILGSGMDSLSLEIYSKNSNVKIFEIDFNTEPKKTIFESLDKNLFQYIFFISADLKNSKNLFGLLKNSGWNPNIPSIVILEGISYYLNKPVLKNLLKIFSTKEKQNNIILEYLVSVDCIAKKQASISEKVFSLISKHIGFTKITRYDKNQIRTLFEKLNGEILTQINMKKMEEKRTKKNIFFKQEKSGWIEICYGSI